MAKQVKFETLTEETNTLAFPQCLQSIVTQLYWIYIWIRILISGWYTWPKRMLTVGIVHVPHWKLRYFQRIFQKRYSTVNCEHLYLESLDYGSSEIVLKLTYGSIKYIQENTQAMKIFFQCWLLCRTCMQMRKQIIICTQKTLFSPPSNY